ncbi:MAG: MFS transporter [candidate division Zixibacteria bacterium]|nr:MFS transporter [candidate division Zixibacteria bacterium]
MFRRNITLFYALESLTALFGGLILPVYVLYFRQYDVSLLQVAILAAVFEATVLVFELPTGIFADRRGRRLSVVFGFLGFALSGLIFFSFRNFTGFLVAEIVLGISETFISGALEALAVDSLDKTDRERILPTLFARRTAYKNTALIVGMIGAGVLARHYLTYLFLPVTLVALAGVPITLALREPARPTVTAESATPPLRSLLASIFSRTALPALFAVGLFSNFTYEGVDQYWQILFAELRRIDPVWFGLITSAGLVLVVVSAGLLKRWYRHITAYLSVGFMLMGVALYLAASGSLLFAVAGIVAFFALKELIRPAISTNINRTIDDHHRATVLSGYNLTCSAGEVLAGVGIGLLASRYGVVSVFLIAAISAVGVLLVYFAVLTATRNRV